MPARKVYSNEIAIQVYERAKTESQASIARDLGIPTGSMTGLVARGRDLSEQETAPATGTTADAVESTTADTAHYTDTAQKAAEPTACAVIADLGTEPLPVEEVEVQPASAPQISEQERVIQDIMDLLPVIREFPEHLEVFKQSAGAIIKRIETLEKELDMLKSQVMLDIAKALVTAVTTVAPETSKDAENKEEPIDEVRGN